MSTPATGDRLGQRAARGAVATLAGQGSRLAIQMASLVILARLLTPHDYGLIAMVMTVAGIAEIFRDFGLSAAAIQAPTLSHRQRSNLFWANAGIGAALTVLVFALAPLVAHFFREPQLVDLTRLLSLTFVLNGLATQYRAGLNRGMRFSRLAVTDVAAQAVGLVVGVGLALTGAGYWALAGMQLAISMTALLQVVVAGRWIPALPSRAEPMGGFFTFGWHLVGTQLLGYATNNVDTLVIGRRFGSVQLGLYDRAYRVLMLPLAQVRTPTTTVALPVLSKLHDDPARFDRFVVRGQQALGYTVIPGLAVAAGTAPVLIPFVLGDQWSASASLFATLAIAGVFQTVAFVGYWVYLARALTAQLFRYSMVSSVVRISCILIGSHWGVAGVAWGVVVGPGLMWPASMWWLSRITRYPVRALALGAGRMLGLAFLAAVAARVAVQVPAPELLALMAGTAAALAVYGLGYLAIRAIRADMTAVFEIATTALRRNRGSA